LYGDWNPSGRLPYTIAKHVEDYPAQVILGTGIQQVISIPYTEGLEIDYRHFDAVSFARSCTAKSGFLMASPAQNNIEPRFEFGFGLSYTKFDYSALSIKSLSTNGGDVASARAWDKGSASPNVEGGSVAAW
jgi:beta-glucosidase